MTKEEIYEKFPFLKYEDVEDDELEDFYNWLMEERRKAYDSYEDYSEARHCSRCGEPLLRGSMAYDEGFHFDTCI